jgi:methylphosphotriester-DNA--protein-cysteine methyltransferase
MRKYIGNKETKLYHVNLPLHEQCEKAVEIDVASMVYFNSRDEAAEAGYRPCLLCIPEGSDHT